MGNRASTDRLQLLSSRLLPALAVSSVTGLSWRGTRQGKKRWGAPAGLATAEPRVGRGRTGTISSQEGAKATTAKGARTVLQGMVRPTLAGAQLRLVARLSRMRMDGTTMSTGGHTTRLGGTIRMERSMSGREHRAAGDPGRSKFCSSGF